ncbi:hypothetical protein D3C72_1400960 [compost metagenome]
MRHCRWPAPGTVWPVDARPRADQVRQRRAEKPLAAAHPERRRLVVPGVLRARRGLRPGVAQDDGGAQWRPLHRQRPEDLDDAGPARQHDVLPGAHQQRGQVAAGHQLPADRHETARRGSAPHPHAGRRQGSERSLPDRRQGAAGKPGGRREQGLDLRQVPADLRAHRHRRRGFFDGRAGKAQGDRPAREAQWQAAD